MVTIPNVCVCVCVCVVRREEVRDGDDSEDAAVAGAMLHSAGSLGRAAPVALLRPLALPRRHHACKSCVRPVCGERERRRQCVACGTLGRQRVVAGSCFRGSSGLPYIYICMYIYIYMYVYVYVYMYII